MVPFLGRTWTLKHGLRPDTYPVDREAMNTDNLFRLKKEDWGLIGAALELGDWLIGHGATDEQVEAIRRLQDALRRLPEPTRINAEYGFDVEDRRVREADQHRDMSEPEKIPVPYPERAVSRSWYVSMYPDKENRMILEIYSLFDDLPRQNVIDEIPHELDFLITSAASQPSSYTYNYDRWICEVTDPTQYVGKHEYIEISTWLKVSDEKGLLTRTDADLSAGTAI